MKLKVGVGDDAGRVAAARAAGGPQLELRLDANGAWEVEEAVRTIEALAPAGLELVEEPVHGIACAARGARPRAGPHRDGRDRRRTRRRGVGRRRRGVPEGLAPRRDLRAAGDGRARAGDRAEVYLASTFDGPLGIAAAVHCAAALRVQAPCGLATLSLLDLPVPGALQVRDGAIAVPAGPGLF